MTTILGFKVKTVGELRDAIAHLPNDMPIHHRGDMGDYPKGSDIILINLAQSKKESDYFAAIEIDPVWKNYKDQFGDLFKALCF